jgi:hypothetical protein
VTFRQQSAHFTKQQSPTLRVFIGFEFREG